MAQPPYRAAAPLARHSLHTPWREIALRVGREAAFALLLVSVVRWTVKLVMLARHIGGGSPRWLDVALAIVPVAAALVALIGARRLAFPRGTTLELYADRLELVTPGRPTRVVSMTSLEIELETAIVEERRVVNGRVLRLPLPRPAHLRIRGGRHDLVVPAAAFETPWHAARLASDVGRIREGKALMDHDRVDAHALLASVDEAFGTLVARKRVPGDQDDLDARLDEEIARESGPPSN
jgi:hypothetical protein